MATKERKRAKSESEGDATATTPAKRKASVEEIEVNLAAPEPPSKKAKRALKKGKALPKKAGSDNDDDLTKDGDGEDEAKQQKKTRGEHGVWIGNLPFTVTPAELKEWLVSNSGGSITDEAITRIKLPTTKEPGRDKSAKPANKGFAYVDFSDIGGKVAAIALSETELSGRRLLIKDSNSYEGRPKKEPEPTTEGADGKDAKLQDQQQAFKKQAEASRKIFVGNMSFKTTEEDVRRNFEKCGEIEFVKVATFEDTGKCKGYGWVRFKEPEAAAWAVKGFVKIKEQVETEDDFKDGDDDDDDDNKPREKQFKTRKWWVNRMLGRELKLELAEDDHVRYKKRFGKDAQNKDGKDKPKESRPRREEGKESRPRREEGSKAPADKGLKESSDIAVARLTGAVVKSTGTKVTFD